VVENIAKIRSIELPHSPVSDKSSYEPRTVVFSSGSLSVHSVETVLK
jgi:hypothetical protein